jgi:opacity protein-like surface antigen
MKRLLISIAALAAVAAGNAQTHDGENYRRGAHGREDFTNYLPKKGDLAMGVDLVGMVKFVGNSISSKSESDAVAPLNGDFFAKYFITDNIALRAHLGLGVANETDRRFVTDDVATPPTSGLPIPKVTDMNKSKSSSFKLGFGAELRRTLRRVQGYAGAELFLATGSYKDTYEYGNAITTTNRNPTSAFSSPYRRTLSESYKAFSGGMALFTGVDYFLSRNVSLGFEFSLSGYGSTTSVRKESYERWDTSNNVYQKVEEEISPKQNRFSIAPSAGANLMFYF